MKFLTENRSQRHYEDRSGFSLIEVVFAIGIFLITVLALVGLLGPTLKSVSDVEQADEVASVVNTVNAFLQSSPDINPGGSRFDAVYRAVADGNFATIVVFRYFDDASTEAGEPPVVRLAIGFVDSEGGTIDDRAIINDPEETSSDRGEESFRNAAGPIYRVVLSASPATPVAWLAQPPVRAAATGVYLLATPDPGVYGEGYFAMEVRIFALEADMQAVQTNVLPNLPLADLRDEEPIFTYNTAIVR